MKMALLGSGIRTPFVLHGLIEHATELGLREVVLFDSDEQRLNTMSALAAYMCRRWDAPFSVRRGADAIDAISDASFIFSAIRVGQETARQRDEELALSVGVIGQETTGPGGFAMALRTIPEMVKYARLIEKHAPGALLVNFTNPVGLVVQALTTQTSVNVVGICDGPVEMKRSIAQFLGVPGNSMYVDYIGLNHLGWIRRASFAGRDLVPELLDRYEELQRSGGAGWALFDADFVRTLGMLPNEYLYFYYNRDLALQHLQRSGTRGGLLSGLNLPLWSELGKAVGKGDFGGAVEAWEKALQTRHQTYFSHEWAGGDQASKGAAAAEPLFEGLGYEGMATAVLRAAQRNQCVPLMLNVPNRGAIPELREDDVVEVTCMAGQNGVLPIAQGATPDQALALLVPVKEYERLTVEAAVTGSYRLALQALVTHPLVGAHATAKNLLDGLLAQNSEYLSYFSQMN